MKYSRNGLFYEIISAEFHLTEISVPGSTHTADGMTITFTSEVCRAEQSAYGGPVIIYQCDLSKNYYMTPHFEFFEGFERVWN